MSQFAFLNQAAEDDQVKLGAGVFMNVPPDYPEFDLEELQALADNEAKNSTTIRPDRTKTGKPYCGKNPVVLFWTLYLMKYGVDPTHPHFGFRNPFYYDHIPAPWDAFEAGKRVANASSIAAGRGPVARAAAPAPAAAPAAPARRSQRLSARRR